LAFLGQEFMGRSDAAPDFQRNPDAEVSAALDAMRRILRQLRVLARKSELAAGLSAAQVFVLTALSRSQGMSVSEVATATLTDRSSAAAVIDRLVELGYADRQQSDEDRRRAVISATPRGRRALKQAAPPPTTTLIDAIQAMPDRDRRSLAVGLTSLVQSMGIDHEPAGMLFEDAPPRRKPSQKGRRRG
jgi:DNA-binding MarR family transcriptional regulator